MIYATEKECFTERPFAKERSASFCTWLYCFVKLSRLRPTEQPAVQLEKNVYVNSVSPNRCDFIRVFSVVGRDEGERWQRRLFGRMGIQHLESRQDVQAVRRLLSIRDGRLDEKQSDSAGVPDVGIVHDAVGPESDVDAGNFGRRDESKRS